MNVYRIDYHDPFEGLLTRWAGNKAEAQRTQADILREYDEADKDPPRITIRPVYIPSHKEGLLRWLNINV